VEQLDDLFDKAIPLLEFQLIPERVKVRRNAFGDSLTRQKLKFL
jgi:hypothetical protein